MHKDDEDTLSVPSSLLFARSSCSSFQSWGREKEREKKMEKNKLLKFEHIVLLSTSNFESSFREISTKGEERKRRESKKKKKKKKK